MEPINELILVTVTPFSGTITPDKNGKMPVMLQLIAGIMPNRNVLSGTVAERAGFVVGKTYLAQVRERGTDEVFGQDFNFLPVKEIESPVDVLKLQKEMGKPQVVAIDRPEEFFERYHRKTVAVEGLTTKRIKEGAYTSAYPKTTPNHTTADEIINGSSTKDNGLNRLDPIGKKDDKRD
jgi:hypothetical protein